MITDETYCFKLYIAGMGTDNQDGILMFKTFMKKKLPHPFELEVIDVLEQPEIAMEDAVLATPSVIQHAPVLGTNFILDFTTEARLSKRLASFFQELS